MQKPRSVKSSRSRNTRTGTPALSIPSSQNPWAPSPYTESAKYKPHTVSKDSQCTSSSIPSKQRTAHLINTAAVQSSVFRVDFSPVSSIALESLRGNTLYPFLYQNCFPPCARLRKPANPSRSSKHSSPAAPRRSPPRPRVHDRDAPSLDSILPAGNSPPDTPAVPDPCSSD